MLIHKLTDKEKELIAVADKALAEAREAEAEVKRALEAKQEGVAIFRRIREQQIAEIRELYFDKETNHVETLSDDGEHLVYQSAPAQCYPANIGTDPLGNIRATQQDYAALRGLGLAGDPPRYGLDGRGQPWVGHPV